ncbi:MAG: hypothetical protein SPLUMA2_SPLUMAMAG2_00915 [uncultured Sulfurimonas sp.]|nr:MAG: hypothetical protein SPLUMA1_SPLUMAMAG1_00811 [uncultured Sulfurimonas sp.]CAI6160709.1 MAG: hypothetical protein SPLUMA2_SPLUMAMAG2_00915 [uncultured Sulfurimonas sp.]
MIRHSNSFIFSIIIHIVIFIALFYTYDQLSIGLKEQKQEPLLCISLCSMSNKTVDLPAPPPIKKNLNKVKDKQKTTRVKQIKKREVQKIATEKKEYKNKILKVEELSIIDEALVSEDEVVETKSLSEEKPKKDIKKKEELPQKPVKVIKVKVAAKKEYIDENIKKIIALLQENLHYPRRARKRGIQGEVLVRFTVSVEAQISNIVVISSNSDILSRGAVQTINNIDNKLPKPEQEITFNVPISYTLY